jgi:hypothetical protein
MRSNIEINSNSRSLRGIEGYSSLQLRCFRLEDTARRVCRPEVDIRGLLILCVARARTQDETVECVYSLKILHIPHYLSEHMGQSAYFPIVTGYQPPLGS